MPGVIRRDLLEGLHLPLAHRQSDGQDEEAAEDCQPEASVQFDELRQNPRHHPEDESSQEDPQHQRDAEAEKEAHHRDDHEDDRTDDGNTYELTWPLGRPAVGHQCDPADPVDEQDHAGLERDIGKKFHDASSVDVLGHGNYRIVLY